MKMLRTINKDGDNDVERQPLNLCKCLVKVNMILITMTVKREGRNDNDVDVV